jgi:hypothetical protein
VPCVWQVTIELQPQQIMTDTAGYSDLIFGLFWLLGFQFSPRLAILAMRDIGGLTRAPAMACSTELGGIACSVN